MHSLANTSHFDLKYVFNLIELRYNPWISLQNVFFKNKKCMTENKWGNVMWD